MYNFFHRYLDHDRFHAEDIGHRNVLMRHNMTHSKMKEKHLTKIPHFYTESVQKSWNNLNKQCTNYKKGRHFFFLAIPRKNWHWLTCTRCFSATPNVQTKIGCRVYLVESLSQFFECSFTIPSASSKLITTAFCFQFWCSSLHAVILYLSCIEVIVQVQIVFSSIK